MTVAYRTVLNASRILINGYARLTVVGAEHIPRDGPVLIVSNHDTPLDAFIIVVATGKRRQIRFLTKQSLWRNRWLAALLDRLQQIPIDRGRHDTSGLESAVAALRAGHCVCVFPEGTLSRGEHLRIRSGAARLLADVPDTVIVGCAVIGAIELKRLRPFAKVGVTFLTVPNNSTSPGTFDSAVVIVQETMKIIRAMAPPSH